MAITERHKRFALAVVQLAKETGIGNVSLEFKTDFKHRSKDGHSWGSVSLDWSEQGHKLKDSFQLIAEQRINVDVPPK